MFLGVRNFSEMENTRSYLKLLKCKEIVLFASASMLIQLLGCTSLTWHDVIYDD